MTRPGVYTGDAPQAFEGIDASFAIECIDAAVALLRRVKGQEFTRSMTVLERTVATTLAGGHVMASYDDRAVLWLDKIKNCLIQLVCMRISRLGDVAALQSTGVPIGGPCSGVLVDLVFSVLEFYTDNTFLPLFATKTWSYRAEAQMDYDRQICRRYSRPVTVVLHILSY